MQKGQQDWWPLFLEREFSFKPIRFNSNGRVLFQVTISCQSPLSQPKELGRPGALAPMLINLVRIGRPNALGHRSQSHQAHHRAKPTLSCDSSPPHLNPRQPGEAPPDCLTPGPFGFSGCGQYIATIPASLWQPVRVPNTVIGTHRISVGSLDRSLVHPREAFRPA
jgi:hypothetical protein